MRVSISPHDRGDRDLLRPLGEAIAANRATLALDEPAWLEVVKNLLQESLPNVLLVGNGLNTRRQQLAVQSQHQHSPQQSISTAYGEFHTAAKIESALKISGMHQSAKVGGAAGHRRRISTVTARYA